MIAGRYSYLQLLHYSDSEWICSHASALLPADNSALRQAAWHSHLVSDGGPVPALMSGLGPCYTIPGKA